MLYLLILWTWLLYLQVKLFEKCGFSFVTLYSLNYNHLKVSKNYVLKNINDNAGMVSSLSNIELRFGAFLNAYESRV